MTRRISQKVNPVEMDLGARLREMLMARGMSKATLCRESSGVDGL
jgi:hypothetical protein